MGIVLQRTTVYKWVKRFSEGRESVTTKRDQDGQEQAELKKTLQNFVNLCVKIIG